MGRPQPEAEIAIRRVLVEINSLRIVGMARPASIFGRGSVPVARLNGSRKKRNGVFDMKYEPKRSKEAHFILKNQLAASSFGACPLVHTCAS